MKTLSERLRSPFVISANGFTARESLVASNVQRTEAADAIDELVEALEYMLFGAPGDRPECRAARALITKYKPTP